MRDINWKENIRNSFEVANIEEKMESFNIICTCTTTGYKWRERLNMIWRAWVKNDRGDFVFTSGDGWKSKWIKERSYEWPMKIKYWFLYPQYFVINTLTILSSSFLIFSFFFLSYLFLSSVFSFFFWIFHLLSSLLLFLGFFLSSFILEFFLSSFIYFCSLGCFLHLHNYYVFLDSYTFLSSLINTPLSTNIFVTRIGLHFKGLPILNLLVIYNFNSDQKFADTLLSQVRFLVLHILVSIVFVLLECFCLMFVCTS